MSFLDVALLSKNILLFNELSELKCVELCNALQSSTLLESQHRLTDACEIVVAANLLIPEKKFYYCLCS